MDDDDEFATTTMREKHTGVAVNKETPTSSRIETTHMQKHRDPGLERGERAEEHRD